VAARSPATSMRSRAARLAGGELVAQLRHLARGRLELPLQLADAGLELLGLGAERARRRADRRAEPLDVGDGGAAGQGLEAPDARRGRLLRDDQEGTDLARPRHVRAAAELDRDGGGAAVADRQTTMRTSAPYFSPKSIIAPGGAGLGERRRRASDRQVGLDPAVHQGLDRLHLLGRDRRAVADVEAEPVGGHQRAGLGDVLADGAPQRGVEEVGGRVVLLGLAPGGIDGDVDPLPDLQLAAGDLDAVHDQPLWALGGAHHDRGAGATGGVAPGDLAGVADLAAPSA
jgi:hypothetical protein